MSEIRETPQSDYNKKYKKENIKPHKGFEQTFKNTDEVLHKESGADSEQGDMCIEV